MIAQALGLHDEPGRDPHTAITGPLRQRRLLLVLDNCEHLLDACAELATALLAACPGLRLLATSREPLRLPGEVAWRVPSLTLPALPLAAVPSAEQLRTLASVDAVRFFWSHALLSPAEADLLHRLAVFTDGWTIAAAEGVCVGGEVVLADIALLLVQLVERSLVVVVPTGGEARYRLLETVRQYARECLEERGESGKVHAAHAHYYAMLAATARPAFGGPDQGRWLDCLDADRQNLRAAIAWATDARRFTLAARLGVDLQYFWSARGYYRDGYTLLVRLLTSLSDQESAPSHQDTERVEPGVHLSALRCAGQLAYWVADYTAAQVLLEQAVLLAEELGNQDELIGVLNILGSTATQRGDHHGAERSFVAGLALAQALRRERQVAAFSILLGWNAFHQERYPEARTLLSEGIASMRQVGDLVSASSGLTILGGVAFVGGNLGEAQTLQEESLALARQVGARRAEVWSIAALGAITCARGDMGASHGHFSAGLRLAWEQGAWWYVANCLDGFANLAALAEEIARALRLRAAAEVLRERLGIAEFPAWPRCYIPAIIVLRQRVDPALDAAIRQAGQHRPLEEAIGEALEERLAV